MPARRAFSLVVILVVAAVSPLAIAASSQGNQESGRKIYLESCRSCHGPTGKGDSDVAAYLTLPPSNLTAMATVAHDELGFPKHHQAMQREGGATFPPKYHELAMAHHQAAEDLAKVIPSKNLRTILPQLEKTIRACVSCHQAYKL